VSIARPEMKGKIIQLTRSRNSIIAITGLDGHAYGSWKAKGNLGRMWLRDFFSKDLPRCRTMVYGYNSKLSSHGIDTILDYGREFMEEIKKVRCTKEVSIRHCLSLNHRNITSELIQLWPAQGTTIVFHRA
jgi:hypothetical protein